MGCKNFGCVYAMKDGCSIKGEVNNGESKKCPFVGSPCIRAYDCTYCIREKDKSDMCIEE